MKKLSLYLTMYICIFMAAFCVMTLKADAANTTSGTLGDKGGITWSYDEDTKTLTITGTDSGLQGKYTNTIYDIKSQFVDICSDVEVISIADCTLSGSAQGMFAKLKSLKSVEFNNFDTTGVTDMSYMFYECSSLESLDLGEFDTSNVTDMRSMFYQCKNMGSLNISNFNTTQVKSMQWMFGFCEKLTDLDLSSFNTSNVTTMNSMFASCGNLTGLDLSNFNTAKVIDMSYMFGICSKMTVVDISNFNTAKVTDMRQMFYECNSLLSLDLSHFNTSNVYYMDSMFEGCNSLVNLDVSNFNTARVTNMSEMFDNCKSLSSLDISDFNTAKVTNMSEMFHGCGKLSELSVSQFNTAKVKNMSGLFRGCDNVKELDVSGFVTTNVTDMSYMFNGCKGVSSLDVSNFNTSQVTKMTYMFGGCNGLDSLDVSGFDTTKVTDMEGMFAGYWGQAGLDLSGFVTENVTTMEGMFSSCKLDSLDLSSFNTSNVTDMSAMFRNCSNLRSLNISGFDTPKLTDVYEMFDECINLTSLDLSGFDLSQVKYNGYMFDNCNSLEIIHTPKAMKEESFVTLPTGFVDPKGTATRSITSPFCNTTLVNKNCLVKQIKFDTSFFSFKVGETGQLNATVLPETAVIKSVTWASSDTNVATVDENGKVSAVGGGTATITATAQDGSCISASCSVTVTQPVTGMALNKTDISITVGGSETLTVTVSPGSATNKAVTWKSSNTAVATVDLNGKVIAVAVGTATITATATDGTGKAASCEVNVTEPMPMQERQVRAFVERMYTVALGRASEPSGIDYWSEELLSHRKDGAAISVGFIMSEEFDEKNYSDEAYLKVLYRTFFDREADKEGLSFWLKEMKAGRSRKSVLAGFVNSKEFTQICESYGITRGTMTDDATATGAGQFVERLYTIAMERPSDPAGLEDWAKRINNKTNTPEQVAKEFFLSPEYADKKTSNEKYVETLYLVFMDRTSEKDGKAYWVEQLNKGVSRESVLEGFAQSGEFKEIMARYGL